MQRLFFAAVAAAILGAPALAAQDATGEQVYTAYYKIGYADLPEWIRTYNAYAVPVLEQLVEEGVITGFGSWQHNTGGEYNWRFVVRSEDWDNFDTFWSAYLSRSAQAAEGDGMEPDMWMRMIQGHYDEIWDITKMNVPAGIQARYMYDSRFQLSFADMGAWDSMWSETVMPVLDQSIADGILAGYVVEGHNTGGRYNWKILYLFEEWDHMDDMFARAMGAMSDPEVWNTMGSMIAAHDDVLWETVPGPEEM
jgi:hypothetical protein